MSRTNSGSDTAGGALAVPMRERYQTQGVLGFQSVTDSVEIRRRDFRRLWAEATRRLLPFCQTAQERQVVADAMRGRMSLNALETLCTVAARMPMPVVLQDALEQAVFGRIAAQPVLCPFTASELEQQANERLNLAQLKANQTKAPAHWLAVAEASGPQIHATVTLREAAWAEARRAS